MDLIENDIVHVFEALRIFQDQVPEDLGGHDKQLGLGIHRDIARVNADHSLAETFAEVAEFLVGKGLDRRRVNDAFAQLHGGLDRVFRDKGLATAGRRCHDKGFSLVNRLDCFFLKKVEFVA